jgi:alpha-L-rhamnosidase
MGIQRKENHIYSINTELLAKSEQAKSTLFEQNVMASHIVVINQDSMAVHGWKVTESKSIDALSGITLGKGDEIIIDFGQPYVGNLELDFIPVGSPPDAPLHVRFIFGEMPIEMKENFSSYNGWISSSWLQQETMHLDILPSRVSLPRRYSFRYLKVEVLDTSPKYKVALDKVSVRHVTTANVAALEPYHSECALKQDIDRVSLKTLENCMQDVFEDGPKRDRRLWLGDLRLQAIANYQTFKNYDLVKHCLYLFAATTNDIGQVSANIFVRPNVIPDDTYLFDYSLMFAVSLYDYYQATNDTETLQELWPTALKQIEIALVNVDEHSLVIDHPDDWWAFFDWNDELNKQASSHALLIYTLNRAISLANLLNAPCLNTLLYQKETLKKASLTLLWDDKQGYFISGQQRQVSWSSQIWMVLADVFDVDQARKLMEQLLTDRPSVKMVTPYMHHHLVDALLHVGLKDKAENHLKEYWGSMISLGADTFWELFDPENPSYSPYGSLLINSYCHAWSCTPTYFLRKHFA